MKTKLTTKKENKEEGPKKAFEEFNIEQSVLDELDELVEDDVVDVNIENQQNSTEDDIQVIDVNEEKKEIVDASSNEFINIVRDNINLCAKEIKEISETMQKIEDQKNSESFWKKGENIRTISKNVNKMSEVQQKTLDLLVMFLGASGKMADDYDTILQTIDELGEVNGGEAEVLNYLLKIKKMVKEIKNNDERLKAITYDNEQLKNKVEKLELNYKEKVTNFEKNSKITISKLNRLNRKSNQMSFFVFLSYILIIALGIVLYVKVFK
jgi:hypothetical protein